MSCQKETAGVAEFDFDAALRIVDASNPQQLPETQRCRIASALVLLADETRSEVLEAADARRAAKLDADGRRKLMAFDAWLTEERRRGGVGLAQAWSIVELLSVLRIWSEPIQPSPASRPGRKPKGDLRVYGDLLCIYEIMTGRRAASDKDTFAFAASFMATAGGSLAAAELESVCPPREKKPGRRWEPLSSGAFRKRFKDFEKVKDLARVHQLIERADQERKK